MRPLMSPSLIPIIIGALLAGNLVAPSRGDFCADYLSKFTGSCPKISSVSTLDLPSFLGRWYEVGASAQFKFRTEFGLSCSTANYKALGDTDDGKKQLSVLNRGLRRVTLLRAQQVLRISASANRIEKNLRRVCEAAQYNTKTKAAAQKYFASLPSTTSSSSSSGPIKTLGDVAARLSEKASVIYAELESAQSVNARVNTYNQPTAPSLAEEKRALRGSIQKVMAAAGQARRVGKFGDKAAASLKKMMGGRNGTRAAELASLLSSSSLSWSGKAKNCLATTRIRMFAASMLPQSVAMLPALIKRGRENRFNAKGVQITTARPGGFSLSPFGRGRSENYVVTSLTGTPGAYTAATVASCSNGRPTVWLLSRTPDVTDAEVTTALTALEAQRIFLGGSNLFIPTNQDLGDCSSYWETT